MGVLGFDFQENHRPVVVGLCSSTANRFSTCVIVTFSGDELGTSKVTTRPAIRCRPEPSFDRLACTRDFLAPLSPGALSTVVCARSLGFYGSRRVGPHSLDRWPIGTCLANARENASRRSCCPGRPRPLVRTRHTRSSSRLARELPAGHVERAR